MAKRIQKKKKTKFLKGESPFKNYWTKENYYILFGGLALIIIGFFLMAQGPYDNPLSLSVSPVILVIAYIIVIPLSIMYRSKKQKAETEEDVSGQN